MLKRWRPAWTTVLCCRHVPRRTAQRRPLQASLPPALHGAPRPANWGGLLQALLQGRLCASGCPPLRLWRARQQRMPHARAWQASARTLGASSLLRPNGLVVVDQANCGKNCYHCRASEVGGWAMEGEGRGESHGCKLLVLGILQNFSESKAGRTEGCRGRQPA